MGFLIRCSISASLAAGWRFVLHLFMFLILMYIFRCVKFFYTLFLFFFLAPVPEGLIEVYTHNYVCQIFLHNYFLGQKKPSR